MFMDIVGVSMAASVKPIMLTLSLVIICTIE